MGEKKNHLRRRGPHALRAPDPWWPLVGVDGNEEGRIRLLRSLIRRFVIPIHDHPLDRGPGRSVRVDKRGDPLHLFVIPIHDHLSVHMCTVP